MISFIVTALDEEENIGATIETLERVVHQVDLSEYEIIVVDDGSTDGTYARVQERMKQIPQLQCIRHPVNQGLGAAIRSGLAVARYPQFMIIPGDNDMQEDFAVSMLTFRDQADLILSAPLNKELRTIWRNVVSMFYQMLYMVSFRLFLTYINGPGIWPTERTRQVNLRARRFAIISEMNVKLLRTGCTFAEVPGYFQAGPKVRSTVTLRNMVEVGLSYLRLMHEVYICAPSKYADRPRRIPIRLTKAH
jgi:glycosyltransferase involved in cell wall biosynthesis